MLTTEFADGARFAEVLAWSDEERQLDRRVPLPVRLRRHLRPHAFNGDPHPGNYMFHPGGRITFLDFGLCKRFTPDEVKVFEEMIRAIVLDHDIAGFRRIVERIGILAADLESPTTRAGEYFGALLRVRARRPGEEITPEYSSESVRRFFDLSGPARRDHEGGEPAAVDGDHPAHQPGLYALFGELGARNNWRQIAEELWPFVDAAPVDTDGPRDRAWDAQRTAEGR